MEYQRNGNTPPPFYGGESAVKRTNTVMRKVYLRMTLGLIISAFCALGIASSQAACMALFGNKIIYWGMLIAMLVMAFVIPARLNRMSTGVTLLLFFLFSALMGVFLAPIFLVYHIGSIVYTFFITAGTFGAMSVFGYFTKQDLSKFGTYLIMALFGLIIASVVNIFLANNTMEWIISIVGVLIFVGLTAFDTQRVKQLSQANLDPAMTDKLATMGAMSLYLDFINLFLYLLRFFGGGRD